MWDSAAEAAGAAAFREFWPVALEKGAVDMKTQFPERLGSRSTEQGRVTVGI